MPYKFTGGFPQSAGMGGLLAPQQQDGGGIFGSYAPQAGGIFAALKDAADTMRGVGSADNFAKFQAQNQQGQMRQQLLQGLTSEDPAQRQQAYGMANLLGIPTDGFQKQQAAAALPKLLQSMQPRQENVASIPMENGASTPAFDYQVPGLNPMDAIAQSGTPELQAQYAPKMLEQQFEMQAKAVRPATAEEKRAAGLSEKTPAQVNAYGQISPISDPFAITPYQQGQLDNSKAGRDLQAAQLAESRRHNQAQEESGREGGGGLFSMIDTPTGMYGVTRKGDVTPMKGPDGKPLVSYHSDVGLRYNMGAAGKGGSAAGTAAEAWPTTAQAFGNIYDTLGKFEKPEFKKQAPYALGGASVLPNVPGLNTNFNSLREQLKGQNFLQAFQALRGAGAITEVEGQKAEQSIARLNSAQTQSEFYAALKDTREVIGRAYQSAKQRAQRGAVLPQMQVQGADPGAGWSNFRVEGQ